MVPVALVPTEVLPQGIASFTPQLRSFLKQIVSLSQQRADRW